LVRVAARLVGFWLGANLALKLAAEADVAPRAGLAVHATDEPFIPAEPFRCLLFPPGLALELKSLGVTSAISAVILGEGIDAGST
jgi:hypothetical protein